MLVSFFAPVALPWLMAVGGRHIARATLLQVSITILVCWPLCLACVILGAPLSEFFQVGTAYRPGGALDTFAPPCTYALVALIVSFFHGLRGREERLYAAPGDAQQVIKVGPNSDRRAA